MDISIKQGNILDERCDLLVVNMFQGVQQPGGATGAVHKALDEKLTGVLADAGFEGKLGEWYVFPTLGRLKAKRVAVVGLGERASFDLDAVRKVGGHIAKRSREAKAKSVVTILHGAGVAGLPVRQSAEALAEGLRLGSYRFHAYKGKGQEKSGKQLPTTVTICERERGKVVQAERGLAEAETIAAAVHLARDLVNTPSQDMTPARLAEVAQEVKDESGRVSIKLLDRERMEKLGMRAALAVARGSDHPPVGVHLVYKPKGKAKKRIVVVGKAVTFDSGGLSIKPADAMMTMKIDMAGAAAVLGLFQALPKLEIPVEVHGIFLAVENMPSGSAYRPGDVVTAMNGKTIEVLNTDAEGRVTLADALSYAVAQKPDAIIDLATLTGACVVALGEEITGLMTNDLRLRARLLLAASAAGEVLWQLPLFGPYEDHIKSKIADLKNIGARGQAGTISAALFLQHFVNGKPWAHLDIAGPSYAEKETRPDLPFGGTGAGVRTLIRYLQGL